MIKSTHDHRSGCALCPCAANCRAESDGRTVTENVANENEQQYEVGKRINVYTVVICTAPEEEEPSAPVDGAMFFKSGL